MADRDWHFKVWLEGYEGSATEFEQFLEKAIKELGLDNQVTGVIVDIDY